MHPSGTFGGTGTTVGDVDNFGTLAPGYGLTAPGAKMTITSKAGENESTQVWSLAGNVLTIESTNARGTQKRVYKKTT